MRLDPLSAVLEGVKKTRTTFLTTACFVGLIRAVTDTVTLSVHLVDALLVLALEAEVGTDTRGYRGVKKGPEIKTHRPAYSNQSVQALLSLTSNISGNQ